MRRIGIVDYGLANMKSVHNAFTCFEADVVWARSPSDLGDVHGIVLPGVGSFDAGMRALRERGFTDMLERRVREGGMSCLGICLGLQFLFAGSSEGHEPGLGWIETQIRRFPAGREHPKVPHIGWNAAAVDAGSRMFSGMEPQVDFYFVHSYYAPLDEATADIATATCDYGLKFVVGIERDNVMAVQFHPEKSQLAGMKVIENFLKAV